MKYLLALLATVTGILVASKVFLLAPLGVPALGLTIVAVAFITGCIVIAILES